MKFISIASATLALCVSSAAFADTYDLEPTHTYAYFKVDHLERGMMMGVFKDVTGAVKIDGKDDAKPSVSATIKVGSLDTFNEKRDQHLLGPDFFNAKRFKTMKFESTAIKKTGDSSYEVTGNLTIKGKTKQVTALMVRGKSGLDPWGMYRIGGNVTLTIDRKDFGVGKKEFDAPLIGQAVSIDLYWEAVRK